MLPEFHDSHGHEGNIWGIEITTVRVQSMMERDPYSTRYSFSIGVASLYWLLGLRIDGQTQTGHTCFIQRDNDCYIHFLTVPRA